MNILCTLSNTGNVIPAMFVTSGSYLKLAICAQANLDFKRRTLTFTTVLELHEGCHRCIYRLCLFPSGLKYENKKQNQN